MGRSYVTWDRRVMQGNQVSVKFTPFPWSVIADSVQASPDAKRLLAIDLAANALQIWPAEDIAAATKVGPGTAKLSDARWRPGTRADVAWVVDNNLAVFTYQTDSSRTLYRGQSFLRIMAFRVDGSGIVLNEQGRVNFFVDLTSGQAVELSDFGGFIAGAVLLR